MFNSCIVLNLPFKGAHCYLLKSQLNGTLLGLFISNLKFITLLKIFINQKFLNFRNSPKICLVILTIALKIHQNYQDVCVNDSFLYFIVKD